MHVRMNNIKDGFSVFFSLRDRSYLFYWFNFLTFLIFYLLSQASFLFYLLFIVLHLFCSFHIDFFSFCHIPSNKHTKTGTVVIVIKTYKLYSFLLSLKEVFIISLFKTDNRACILISRRKMIPLRNHSCTVFTVCTVCLCLCWDYFQDSWRSI